VVLTLGLLQGFFNSLNYFRPRLKKWICQPQAAHSKKPSHVAPPPPLSSVDHPVATKKFASHEEEVVTTTSRVDHSNFMMATDDTLRNRMDCKESSILSLLVGINLDLDVRRDDSNIHCGQGGDTRNEDEEID
jgi:hypothetical protein